MWGEPYGVYRSVLASAVNPSSPPTSRTLPLGGKVAMSGLNQLDTVTRAFAFGGTGNILTANGVADVALDGSEVYPSSPLD